MSLLSRCFRKIAGVRPGFGPRWLRQGGYWAEDNSGCVSDARWNGLYVNNVNRLFVFLAVKHNTLPSCKKTTHLHLKPPFSWSHFAFDIKSISPGYIALNKTFSNTKGIKQLCVSMYFLHILAEYLRSMMAISNINVTSFNCGLITKVKLD